MKSLKEFAEFCKIINYDEGLIPLTLRDHDEALLEHIQENNFTVINSSRQCGSSTALRLYTAWYACYNQYSTIGLFLTKLDYAKEEIKKIKLMLEGSPLIDHCNDLTIIFKNGSRIIANSIRPFIKGIRLDVLIATEIAYVEDKIWGDFYTNVIPISQKNVLLSIPHGENHFHKLWKKTIKGTNELAPFTLNWRDIPERNYKWRKEMIKNIGLQAFNSEYDNQFV